MSDNEHFSIGSPLTPKRPRVRSPGPVEENEEEKSEQYRPYEEILEMEEPCCDNPHIREENGFYVCLNCGLVFDIIFDTTPRRAFTAEEVKNRKGSEPVYSKIGPRTVIRGASDAKGTQLAPEEKSKFNRLAKIHRSLTTLYERNLWIALPNLQRFQERLGLPDAVAEDALRIYTHAVKEKLTMGAASIHYSAASIFAAFRIHYVPRTLEEITEIGELNKKNVVKAFRLILMKILPQLNLKVQHFGPIRYVDKFTEELGTSMNVRNAAVQLLESAKKMVFRWREKTPKVLQLLQFTLQVLNWGKKRLRMRLLNFLALLRSHYECGSRNSKSFKIGPIPVISNQFLQFFLKKQT